MGNNNSIKVKTDKDNQSFVIGSIHSGFGNQMFQIACAYAYSKKYNNTFDIKTFFVRKESSNIDSIIQKNIITMI